MRLPCPWYHHIFCPQHVRCSSPISVSPESERTEEQAGILHHFSALISRHIQFHPHPHLAFKSKLIRKVFDKDRITFEQFDQILFKLYRLERLHLEQISPGGDGRSPRDALEPRYAPKKLALTATDECDIIILLGMLETIGEFAFFRVEYCHESMGVWK
ncbi:hypothetical protein NM688_g4172 [Phlebia brevispora]|uniref:Uncharacterized protein n=1 Tax=Phlebia brevispora TaxID=194682 RepID=A0ACC1T3N6_9APHY|nr:hypothetical protein NM688_g4172 [Phlebia brevispora]